MIQNLSTNAFNSTGAESVYYWNSELILACLMIIAFCSVINLIMTLGGMVLKMERKQNE